MCVREGFLLVGVAVLVGCAMPNGYYQPATVAGGVISNSKVGWNGYSVKVSEGFSIFNPAMADPESEDLTDLQRSYMAEENRYSRALGISYTEWFLLEHRLLDCSISFSCSTYEIGMPWASMTSLDKDYFLRKLINHKMVLINDTQAHNELVSINGHPGWYISGTAKPYFGRQGDPLAYEAFFILGGLKEAYWFEGFGAIDSRSLLKRLTRDMAERLDIK